MRKCIKPHFKFLMLGFYIHNTRGRVMQNLTLRIFSEKCPLGFFSPLTSTIGSLWNFAACEEKSNLVNHSSILKSNNWRSEVATSRLFSAKVLFLSFFDTLLKKVFHESFFSAKIFFIVSRLEVEWAWARAWRPGPEWQDHSKWGPGPGSAKPELRLVKSFSIAHFQK